MRNRSRDCYRLATLMPMVRGTRLTLGVSYERSALLPSKGADAVRDYPVSGHLLIGTEDVPVGMSPGSSAFIRGRPFTRIPDERSSSPTVYLEAESEKIFGIVEQVRND